MNTNFFFALIILISFFSFNSYSQNVAKEIQMIDSLINSRLDFSKVDAFGKSNSSEIKTRGINPCDSDYDNLVMLFKNLKSNYASCCQGKTNYTAVALILSSIHSIVNNPNCKWGVGSWLVISYYLNDYSNFVDKYNCCK